MIPATLIALALSSTSAHGLTLKEAVARALADAPALRAAGHQVEQRDAAELRAELDRFSLRVDLQIEELWNKANIGAGRAPVEDGALGLSNLSAHLTVPLFTGFRVEAAIDRAEALLGSAQAELAEERRATALAVARAYWAARRLALLHAVEQRAIRGLAEAEAAAAARVRAGLAPPIDANRAAARRLEQAALLADLEGAIAEAEAGLAVALRLPELVPPTDPPLAPAPAPKEAALLIAEAIVARPEIQAARLRAAAQREAVRIVEAAYYPQLSAYALLQVGNNPFLAGAGARAVFGSANPFDNVAGDFQVGGMLAFNIFDTWNTKTAADEARAEEARLVEQARAVARVVEAEVRRARQKVIRHREVLARLEPALAVAGENVAIVRGRYERGEALIFELLDTERELLAMERRRSEAEAEHTIARIELDAALGAIVGEER